MTSTEARHLYAYNRWANQQMLQAVQPLNADEFTRDMKNSFPSVRDTLVHILSAEWIWLQRWTGVSPRESPAGWSKFAFAELELQWAAHEHEQSAFLDQLTDAKLVHPLSYTNTRGEAFTAPLHQLVRHVVNHSSYHRGQVTTLLRQLGHAAATTDLVVFDRRVAARTNGIAAQ
jgi:uncharacterized damage-inducible protein DinB